VHVVDLAPWPQCPRLVLTPVPGGGEAGDPEAVEVRVTEREHHVPEGELLRDEPFEGADLAAVPGREDRSLGRYRPLACTPGVRW